MLNVRYGKAKKGQPPRRRNVASVMGSAVEAVSGYVENVRPRFGCGDHPALWVTERGGRVKPSEINARFVAYRDALGLPKALTPSHKACLRQPSHRGWRPERLSLKVLMALLDILDCSMDDLIEPVAVAEQAREARAVGGEASAGVGALRPKRPGSPRPGHDPGRGGSH
jgi:Cro/C1-type HTH DNA-binding domain